jgi:hypothetical protein
MKGVFKWQTQIRKKFQLWQVIFYSIMQPLWNQTTNLNHLFRPLIDLQKVVYRLARCLSLFRIFLKNLTNRRKLLMRISKELQDIRNALRPTTQRTAQKLMQEIEAARQAAAAKSDREEVAYLAEQIKHVAEASTLADFEAVDNAVISWNKRKAAQEAEADKALAAIQPPSDPIARLNAARKLQARRDKA